MNKWIWVMTAVLLLGSGCSKVPPALPIPEVRSCPSTTTLENRIEKLEEKNALLLQRLSETSNNGKIMYDGTEWNVGDATWISKSLLDALPTEWKTAWVSRSEGLYLVTRDEYGIKDVDETILANTRSLFPSSDVPEDDLQQYWYYVWADHSFEANLYGTKRTLPAHELIPITTIYWPTALTFCSASILPYEGALAVSCGGGDNGCFTKEKVKIDLFDGKIEYIGICSNSCDLPPESPYRVMCN